MATVIYNGFTLPNQHGKITFESDDDQMIRFTTNFSILATALASTLDTLKIPDQELTIFGTAYNVTGTGLATRIKTRVIKRGLDADSNRQYLTLVVEVTLKDDKPAADGIRDWSSDRTVDEQGMKTITVQGRITATANGDSALTNYNSEIGGLEATVQALYGGGTYFPARREITEHDKFDNELRFQSIIVESLETANVYTGAAEAFDTGIMFSKWAHSRRRGLVRGHSDRVAEFVTVTFECLFDRAFATSRTDLETRIAGLVIKRLKEQFLCSNVILESDDESFSSTNQSARATWTFRCDNGPQFITYDEVVSDVLIYGDASKITDGKPLTMATFSPGAMMQLTQRVTAEYAQASPGDPPPPSIAGIAGAVLIPRTRSRDRGQTNHGTSNIGIGDQTGSQEVRHSLVYSKEWWVVIPSPDDPDSSEVKPPQPG